MAAFKDSIDARVCRTLAQAYNLDDAFVRNASSALPKLELKARVNHVADTLRAWLDPDFEVAARQLLDGLPPALVTTDQLALGMGWWPVVSVVERHGVAHPDASLNALAELTKRFSAEFAVRPFLRDHPDKAWAAVKRWTTDPNPHVRRLASEGTRPRLPWGGRLHHAPAWWVLDALVGDDELYVRRSVANHLGDIAKDHPDQAVEQCRAWTPHDWVVRHGLRHLVKKGHLGALELQGFGAPQLSNVRFNVTPTVDFPGKVTFTLDALSHTTQALVIDAVVHFVTAKGTGPKTWKWSTKTVPQGPLSMMKTYTLKPISTRTFHSGVHRVQLQVNGRVLADSQFELRT